MAKQLSLAADYPYEGVEGICREKEPVDEGARRWHLSDYSYWSNPSVEIIKELLMKTGPLISSIDLSEGLSYILNLYLSNRNVFET